MNSNWNKIASYQLSLTEENTHYILCQKTESGRMSVTKLHGNSGTNGLLSFSL